METPSPEPAGPRQRRPRRERDALPPAFDLEERLGRGASSEVWRARLREPLGIRPADAPVAVKILASALASDERAIAAFGTEAEAGRVRHPGLVEVLGQGLDERGRWLVTGYVPGRTLREEIEGWGALAEPRVRTIGARLAGALAALHAAGWIHRDVKPENVRLDAEGAPVLLDLGLACRIETEAGERPGSLAYLAPEQARGEQATPQSDVFALGLVLFELATASHPFAQREDAPVAGTPPELLERLARAELPPPSSIVPQCSPFLDRLLERVCAADPARRPSAAELERILVEGEAGAWWREVLAFDARARRDTLAWSGRHLTPLVGRASELARLDDAFARAAAGDGGRVVWLEGEAGSGKSRLVTEFVTRVRSGSTPPLYLYGRCTPWVEGRPGHPLRALLRRWLRLPRGSAPGPRERALLADLLPPREAQTLVATLDPRFRGPTELSVPVAMGSWLLRLGTASPLVVYLDDLEWAGAGTLEILSGLATSLAGTRLLLILGLRKGVRPNEPEALARLRRTALERAAPLHLDLGPIDEDAVLAAVEELFHPSVPRVRLARALARRTGGSPGLLTEVLRTLLAHGDAAPASRDDERLVLHVAPEELPVPRSVARLIVDRYLELPKDEQLWLQRLSIVGGHIEVDFLTRAFPPASRVEVEQVLARLARSGWLVPVGPRYRFARPAQREAVYRSMRNDRRQRLHAAAARALGELSAGQRGLDTAFQRVFHLRSAAQHAELLRVLRPLVTTLLERGHPQRVHTLATWGLDAIEALPSDPERDRLRIELLEAAADAADRRSYREDQRALLDRLSDLDLDPERDPVAVGRVYLLHGRYAGGTGRYGLARGLLRNAEELFERAGTRGLASEAARRLAFVQSHVGELEKAVVLARRALERAVDDTQRGLAHLLLAEIDLLQDRFETAQRTIDRAMKLLRRDLQRASGKGAVAGAYLLRSRTHRLLGRPRRAYAAVQIATRLAVEAGERRLEVEIGAWRGRLFLDVSLERDAELGLREALFLAREIEYPRGEALASVFLGTLLAEGDAPEADDVLGRAVGLARRLGVRRLEALGVALQARIARQHGELERALELAITAEELIEHFGGELPDRLMIRGTRVLVLRSLGREGAAAQQERELRRLVRRRNEAITALVLRQRHRRFSTRLLAAVLSPDGPVYPRVRMPDLPGEPLPGP